MTPGSPDRSRGTADLRLARACIASGALLMLLAVILGAVGSHLLQARLSPARFASYQSGVSYHLIHALALVAIGLLAHVTARTRWLVAAALLFSVGIACFSGAIYAMAFGAPRTLGVVAPFGGVAFMIGWVCVAAHALRSE